MKIIIATCLILGCAVLAASAQTNGQTSPYVFPQFKQANILQKGGATIQAQLNYNLLTQEMCFIQDNKIMIMDQLDLIDTIYFDKRKFIPVGTYYYEKLTDTPVPLFIQYKGKTVTGPKNANLQTQQNNLVTQGRFGYKSNNANEQSANYNAQLSDGQVIVLQSIYYLQKEGKLTVVDNIKNLTKLFPGKDGQIQAFLKGNSISFSNPVDVAKLVVAANK